MASAWYIEEDPFSAMRRPMPQQGGTGVGEQFAERVLGDLVPGLELAKNGGFLQAQPQVDREYVAPFRDDAECLRWLRYPEPPDRRHRIEVFAAAYGLTSTAGLVDAVIDVQRSGIAQVRGLAERGCQPQVRGVADGHLDDLARRAA